jgi:hypothetical protein
VYRDGKLIVKWDLDNQKPMKGAATRPILELIWFMRPLSTAVAGRRNQQ